MTKIKQPRDAKGRFMSSKTTTSTTKGKKGKVSTGKSSSTSTKTPTSNKSTSKKGTGSRKTSKPKKETAKKVITIHNVHLLDASSSMRGSKYENAITGINAEQTKLKNSKDKYINYTQSVYEFRGVWSINNTCEINTHYTLANMKDTSTIIGKGANGNTPLNEAVGNIISFFLKNKKEDEKVALTIFTDGEENCSKGEFANPANLARLIKQAEANGFTVTFMGTEVDTKRVIRDLGIDASNTIVHDNTAAGIGQTYYMRSTSMDEYTEKLKKGKNVTFGFFSHVKK